MEVNTFIAGIILGIFIAVIIMLIIKKLADKKKTADNYLLTVVGKWQMPADIANIEPLKPPFIEITNNSNGYQIIQGDQTTKLEINGAYYIPASSGAPMVGITFHYETETDTLVQEIGGHPFTYTRILI